MIVDFDVLALVVVASAVLAKLFEALKNRLQRRYDALPDWGREVWGYAAVVFSGALMWSTGLNGLPGFAAPVGRILTCVTAGFGPGLVYDMFLDRPQVTPQPPQP